MPYKVELVPAARRDLRPLDRADARRVLRVITRLQDEPRPPGFKMLRGNVRLYRIRVGDYRVIYEIHDERSYVLVLRARHRRDVYR